MLSVTVAVEYVLDSGGLNTSEAHPDVAWRTAKLVIDLNFIALGSNLRVTISINYINFCALKDAGKCCKLSKMLRLSGDEKDRYGFTGKGRRWPFYEIGPELIGALLKADIVIWGRSGVDTEYFRSQLLGSNPGWSEVGPESIRDRP